MTNEEKYKKNLSKKIVQIRTKKGLTQAQLARLLDKDPQTIERLERGVINPKGYTIYLLANALEVDINELFDF